ncbi:MAG: hypothetical protein IT545_14230 [Rhodobacteraceae bacterium]|nr:hypothetical protein [Paracoccaceae bacterium]
MPPAAGTDSCGASGLQHLVGRSVTAAGDLSARGPVRILRPGDAMTMDYAPRRINVLLDAQDRIREITCG